MDKLKLLALFVEGQLTFFSPCILPILPVYLSLLGGQVSKGTGVSGSVKSRRLLNVCCFVLGIAASFFLLAFASHVLSRFLIQQKRILKLFGGFLILLLGFLQLGVLKMPVLNREFSFKQRVYRAGQRVTPFLSMLMGFAFSFSWTPCIGPILASVLFYASGHKGWEGTFLVTVYCLGFTFPFIILALFSEKILEKVKNNYKILKYTKILSALILIAIGSSILIGNFSKLTRLFY